MRRKSRLQAKLTGEEWKPAPAPEEATISNSEMIELVKEQAGRIRDSNGRSFASFKL